MEKRVLLLEDDRLYSETLRDFLEEEGFRVECVYDPLSAYDLAYQKGFDLYLFDINLPFEDGIEALEQLRRAQDTTPTIFITSREDKESLIKGFQAGADDYIKKPIDLDEFLMRIEAVLKRVQKSRTLSLGAYILDRDRKDLYYKEEPLGFGQKLYLLLELLATNDNRAVSYDEIYNRLWPEQEPNHGTLRVYIAKLKKYFPQSIATMRGFGYKFDKSRL